MWVISFLGFIEFVVFVVWSLVTRYAAINIFPICLSNELNELNKLNNTVSLDGYLDTLPGFCSLPVPTLFPAAASFSFSSFRQSLHGRAFGWHFSPVLCLSTVLVSALNFHDDAAFGFIFTQDFNDLRQVLIRFFNREFA